MAPSNQLQALDLELHGSVSLKREDIGPSLQSLLRSLQSQGSDKQDNCSADPESMSLGQLAAFDPLRSQNLSIVPRRETDAETTHATFASEVSNSLSDETTQPSEFATSVSEVSHASYPTVRHLDSRRVPHTIRRRNTKTKCNIF